MDITVTNLSQKSRCVAGQETARIRQIGATGIIALHLSSFVKQVRLLHERHARRRRPRQRHGDAAHARARSSRRASSIGTADSPLFESKVLDIPDVSRELPDFDDYDLVLVADFGHGLLDAARASTRASRRQRTRFVAAMAQVNSSNYGYNLPVKYVGADYYSLNRTEAELSLHEKDLPSDELIDRMARAARRAGRCR